MLVLAAFGMLVPAIFHGLPEVTTADVFLEHELSVGVSIVLLASYGAHLVFSLKTHKGLFNPTPDETDAGADAAHAHGPLWSTRKAVAVLVGATLFVAWMSEILVGAIEPAAKALGLGNAFIAIFVVAVLGNAAEHSTAITVAMKNRMDLALSIAIGSSIQVALFVAPVLVLLSLAIGPRPMDLAFPGGLVLIVLLSVLITGQVASDGRSDWLKGVQLLAVYGVLGLTVFFLAI